MNSEYDSMWRIILVSDIYSLRNFQLLPAKEILFLGFLWYRIPVWEYDKII